MFTKDFEELLNEYQVATHKLSGLLIEVDVLRKKHDFITVPYSRMEMPEDKKEFSCKLMDEVYVIDSEIEVLEKSLIIIKDKIKMATHK